MTTETQEAKSNISPKTGKKRTGYFYEREEQAVIDYLSTDDADKKQEIYNSILRPAFDKMIESIIRRYKLFVPNEIFRDTFDDTASFLLTKMDKFEPGRFKAYSYYGTICKNYLIGRIQGHAKALKNYPSYDAMEETFRDGVEYVDDDDSGRAIAAETIEQLTGRIGAMIEHPDKYSLKPSECSVGRALISLFEDWDYILSTDCSRKFNKSVILQYMKDQTGLDAKTLRENLKKYKKEFLEIKAELID